MIARVALEIALGREFDYSIPSEFAASVQIGTRVKVPFGPRQVLGCVTQLLESSPHDKLRPIAKVLGRQSLVTPKILELARWISDYYCCPFETTLKSVLPEAVRKEKAGWREQLWVYLTEPLPEHSKLTPRQKAVLEILLARKELALTELVELAQSTAGTIRKLEDKGILTIQTKIVERDPYAREEIIATTPLALSPEQQRALAAIEHAIQTPSKPLLLHGVTGSGKTEVYLQAIDFALSKGKGAIVLVPEISLTPQTVERFKARFSSGTNQTLVAVLHSHLSAGERHDEWHKIRQGRARIAIGARSAIFAPVEPLGLIIVDEEHEHSYKQEESPRYHARDVAVVRAQKENAAVVLGSATPSMESFFNVHRKKYDLLEMPHRADDKKMPLIRVVDMRQTARIEKGIPIFSPQLRKSILDRLDKNEQVILFLNRRGFASSMQCPLCGYVAECPNCSVSLTYHKADEQLRCHVCGHNQAAPKVCPQESCRNPAIRFSGIGTEKVETLLKKHFPHARIRRMDSDTLKRKEDYRQILGDFRTRKIDILVGTQMIAKGLHFPSVTLVGIIYADLSLHVPDFRAGERTFQLITQVAGRAGRGDVEGEVYVQSFTPFHPAIQYARRHDYNGFYDQEMEFRQQLQYPPLTRAALITLSGRNEDKVKFAADYLRKQLDSALSQHKNLIIAGPGAAPLARAETLYRYQLMVRTKQMTLLSRTLPEITNNLQIGDDVRVTIDIDPVNLM